MGDKIQLLANLQEQRQAPIAIDSGAQPSSDPCGVSSPDDSVLIFKYQ